MFSTLEGADLSVSLSFRTSQNTDGPHAASKRHKNSISLPRETVLEPFQRDQLFTSILSSCQHRNTAISDATALTSTILGRLRPHMLGAVIDRDVVVKTTHDILKRFDKAAAVQYAAFHPVKRG